MNLFRFDNLSQIPGVVHGISTRSGGVSQGRCKSLNVSYSVGDARENVDENIRRVSCAIGSRPEDVVSAYQVHGRGVSIVESHTETEPRPRCDVLATSSSAHTLMLRFADCAPVLLADSKRRDVAVVHAGWRGSAVRAAAAAVEALGDRFGSRPEDIVAGIGPAIGPCCYVVGQDVVDAFADRPQLLSEARIASLAPSRMSGETHGDSGSTSEPPQLPSNARVASLAPSRVSEESRTELGPTSEGPTPVSPSPDRERAQRGGSGETRSDSGSTSERLRLFRPKPERERAQRGGWMLDLWEANRLALIEAGVLPEHIELAGVCTQCESERFFSHRANGGQPAGRFAALIRIED